MGRLAFMVINEDAIFRFGEGCTPILLFYESEK